MPPVDVINASDGIPPEAAVEWDRLATAVGAPPFLRRGWIEAWRRSFGRGSLELYRLRRQGALAALIPLERRGGGLLASPTNAHSPLFGPLAVDAASARELMRAILQRPYARVSLEHLSDESAVVPSFSAAASDVGCRTSTRLVARSPYVDIHGDRQRYERSLSAKLLREVSRRRQRLETEGTVTLGVTDGGTRLLELLDEGLDLEGAAWKGSIGTAIESDPRTGTFYRAIASWASRAGILRLAFLRVGDRAVAFDFCLEQAGVHYLLKTGFDPTARRFGPGIMMRREMIARAFAEGLSSYEFLGKDEDWKLRWATHARPRLSWDAFSTSLHGSASRFWWTGARPLGKRLLRRA